MRKAFFGLALLIGTLALTANAQVINQKDKVAPDLKTGIATRTKFKTATVEKMLEQMGPAIKEQLRAGRVVAIDGVGTFQVVRIQAYKDINRNGEPVLVPARNYVEFLPDDGLNEAANAEGAVPARTVEGYKFVVNPNQAPTLKVESIKVLRTRIR